MLSREKLAPVVLSEIDRADSHDEEVLKWQRLLLVDIFAITAGVALIFHFHYLQPMRENIHTLAPATQYLIKNFLDYIGNVEPTYVIGGLLPVGLDLGLVGIETMISIIKGERYQFPNIIKLVIMAALLDTLMMYNFDTEIWQKLFGSYGDPNIKDIPAGIYGILSAALTVDTMHSVFRRASAWVYSKATQRYNIAQENL